MDKAYDLTQIEKLQIENLSLKQELLLREMKILESLMQGVGSEIKERLHLGEEVKLTFSPDRRQVLLEVVK